MVYCSNGNLTENLVLKVGLDTYTVYPDGTWDPATESTFKLR